MPNKLSRFWQELKRRKVTRVVTVYAASAFVILELVDIIAEPLKLPEWFLTAVIIILCIGFIITVIVSWIYDIHPEGGIVKTEPVHKVNPEGITKSSNSWKIASYISFVVIVGLILLNVITHKRNAGVSEILDKSIAVLPFINDSQDKENEHFINGIMEELLINLQSIKELRVPGRTSTEQYRNNPKSIPEIATEMNVAYIVEGSGQRYGNRIRLRIQLVEGKTDRHIWADSYDEVINGPEDIFRIQSDIAESIAAELQALITPEEKDLIENVPTTNLTAYDFYQRGREESWNGNIDRAEELYKEALRYDSTFAQAYTGLALLYWNRHYWEEYFSEDFLDSVLILSDIALSYDDKLAEGYIIRGQYYRQFGNTNQAIKEFDRAIRLNPNDWQAYTNKGWLYFKKDPIKAIYNFQKAASLNHGPQRLSILGNLSDLFRNFGFMDKSRHYDQEILEFDNDSLTYYFRQLLTEYYQGNYINAINYGKRIYSLDTTDVRNLSFLGLLYTLNGQYDESLEFWGKYRAIEPVVTLHRTEGYHRIGYIYLKFGNNEIADYYINEHIRNCNRRIELAGPGLESETFYDLASAYAFIGEKELAYENLRIFDKRQSFSIDRATLIKYDPLFDSMRDEPEFQQIVRDVEAKYRAEHERIRQWLEENEML